MKRQASDECDNDQDAQKQRRGDDTEKAGIPMKDEASLSTVERLQNAVAALVAEGQDEVAALEERQESLENEVAGLSLRAAVTAFLWNPRTTAPWIVEGHNGSLKCLSSNAATMSSLCEEIGFDGEPFYRRGARGSYKPVSVALIDESWTEETWERVLNSDAGGSRLREEYLNLEDITLADLLAICELDNLSLFSPISHEPMLLEWLIRDNFYDLDLLEDNSDAIVTCRNLMGLEMLLAAGFDSDDIGNGDAQPLTDDERTATMADALLTRGARIDLLTGKKPTAEALRVMLLHDPITTKAVFPGTSILHLVEGGTTAIECVQVMREFNYETPTKEVVQSLKAHAGAALFAFNYICERPRLPLEPGMALVWRPHTHFAFGVFFRARHDCAAVLQTSEPRQNSARHSRDAFARGFWL